MTKYLQDLIYIVNNYEEILLSNISDANQPLFLLAVRRILCLSSVCMFCACFKLQNNCRKLLVLYTIEHKGILDKISKYPYMLKIINLYKNTRLYYLLFEIILFFISLVCLQLYIYVVDLFLVC